MKPTRRPKPRAPPPRPPTPDTAEGSAEGSPAAATPMPAPSAAEAELARVLHQSGESVVEARGALQSERYVFGLQTVKQSKRLFERAVELADAVIAEANTDAALASGRAAAATAAAGLRETERLHKGMMSALTPDAAPARPTHVRAQPLDDRSMALAWQLGADNGRAITHVRVSIDPPPAGAGAEGGRGDSTGSSAEAHTVVMETTEATVVTGLVPRTSYALRVQAKNAKGWSVWSTYATTGAMTSASEDLDDKTTNAKGKANGKVRAGLPETNRGKVSTHGAPNAPLAVVAIVRGADRVQLRWTAPNACGAVVTHYEIQVSPAPDAGQPPEFVVDTRASAEAKMCTHDITGLTPGAVYTFCVRGRNKYGIGSLSAPSRQIVMQAGPPSAVPFKPLATPIMVPLTPPSAAPAASAATNATMTSVHGATVSKDSNIGGAGNPAITVAWQLPNSHGAALVHAQLQHAPAQEIEAGQSTNDDAVARSANDKGDSTLRGMAEFEPCERYRVHGLTPGVDFAFRVRFSNAIGWGPWSSWSRPCRVNGVPDAPKDCDLAVCAVDEASVRISWQAQSEGQRGTKSQSTASQGGLPILRTEVVLRRACAREHPSRTDIRRRRTAQARRLHRQQLRQQFLEVPHAEAVSKASGALDIGATQWYQLLHSLETGLQVNAGTDAVADTEEGANAAKNADSAADAGTGSLAFGAALIDWVAFRERVVEFGVLEAPTLVVDDAKISSEVSTGSAASIETKAEADEQRAKRQRQRRFVLLLREAFTAALNSPEPQIEPNIEQNGHRRQATLFEVRGTVLAAALRDDKDVAEAVAEVKASGLSSARRNGRRDGDEKDPWGKVLATLATLEIAGGATSAVSWDLFLAVVVSAGLVQPHLLDPDEWIEVGSADGYIATASEAMAVAMAEAVEDPNHDHESEIVVDDGDERWIFFGAAHAQIWGVVRDVFVRMQQEHAPVASCRALAHGLRFEPLLASCICFPASVIPDAAVVDTLDGDIGDDHEDGRQKPKHEEDEEFADDEDVARIHTVETDYSDTATVIRGLRPGARYSVQVRYGNAIGWGVFSGAGADGDTSAPSSLVATTFRPPIAAAVAPLASDVGGTTAAVSWAHAMPIGEGDDDHVMRSSNVSTHVRVEVQPTPQDGQPHDIALARNRVVNGIAETANNLSSVRLGGLQQSTCYRFRLHFRNSSGFGVPSPWTDIVKTCEPPHAPKLVEASPVIQSSTSVQATTSSKRAGMDTMSSALASVSWSHREDSGVIRAQHRRLRVSWAAPGNDGGAAVTHYEIEVSPTPEAGQPPEFAVDAHTGKEAQVCAHNIDGLVPGTNYTFRVRARNAAGVGAFSQPSSAVTLAAAPPDPPPRPTVVALAPTSVYLRWDRPCSNGAEMQDYVVESEAVPVAPWRLSSSQEVSGARAAPPAGDAKAAAAAAVRGRRASLAALAAANASLKPTIVCARDGNSCTVHVAPPDIVSSASHGTHFGTNFGEGSGAHMHHVHSKITDFQFRFRVRARNAVGTGAASPFTPLLKLPYLPPPGTVALAPTTERIKLDESLVPDIDAGAYRLDVGGDAGAGSALGGAWRLLDRPLATSATKAAEWARTAESNVAGIDVDTAADTATVGARGIVFAVKSPRPHPLAAAFNTGVTGAKDTMGAPGLNSISSIRVDAIHCYIATDSTVYHLLQRRQQAADDTSASGRQDEPRAASAATAELLRVSNVELAVYASSSCCCASLPNVVAGDEEDEDAEEERDQFNLLHEKRDSILVDDYSSDEQDEEDEAEEEAETTVDEPSIDDYERVEQCWGASAGVLDASRRAERRACAHMRWRRIGALKAARLPIFASAIAAAESSGITQLQTSAGASTKAKAGVASGAAALVTIPLSRPLVLAPGETRAVLVRCHGAALVCRASAALTADGRLQCLGGWPVELTNCWADRYNAAASSDSRAVQKQHESEIHEEDAEEDGLQAQARAASVRGLGVQGGPQRLRLGAVRMGFLGALDYSVLSQPVAFPDANVDANAHVGVDSDKARLAPDTLVMAVPAPRTHSVTVVWSPPTLGATVASIAGHRLLNLNAGTGLSTPSAHGVTSDELELVAMQVIVTPPPPAGQPPPFAPATSVRVHGLYHGVAYSFEVRSLVRVRRLNSKHKASSYARLAAAEKAARTPSMATGSHISTDTIAMASTGTNMHQNVSVPAAAVGDVGVSEDDFGILNPLRALQSSSGNTSGSKVDDAAKAVHVASQALDNRSRAQSNARMQEYVADVDTLPSNSNAGQGRSGRSQSRTASVAATDSAIVADRGDNADFQQLQGKTETRHVIAAKDVVHVPRSWYRHWLFAPHTTPCTLNLPYISDGEIDCGFEPNNTAHTSTFITHACVQLPTDAQSTATVESRHPFLHLPQQKQRRAPFAVRTVEQWPVVYSGSTEPNLQIIFDPKTSLGRKWLRSGSRLRVYHFTKQRQQQDKEQPSDGVVPPPFSSSQHVSVECGLAWQRRCRRADRLLDIFDAVCARGANAKKISSNTCLSASRPLLVAAIMHEPSAANALQRHSKRKSDAHVHSEVFPRHAGDEQERKSEPSDVQIHVYADEQEKAEEEDFYFRLVHKLAVDHEHDGEFWQASADISSGGAAISTAYVSKKDFSRLIHDISFGGATMSTIQEVVVFDSDSSALDASTDTATFATADIEGRAATDAARVAAAERATVAICADLSCNGVIANKAGADIMSESKQQPPYFVLLDVLQRLETLAASVEEMIEEFSAGAGLHDECAGPIGGKGGSDAALEVDSANSHDTFAIANPLSANMPTSEKTAAAAKASAALSGRSRAESGADMRRYVANGDSSTSSGGYDAILARRALLHRLRRLRCAHLDLARTWRVRGDDVDGNDTDPGRGKAEAGPTLGPFVHDAATHIRWWQAEAMAAVGDTAYLHSTRAPLPGNNSAGTSSTSSDAPVATDANPVLLARKLSMTSARVMRELATFEGVVSAPASATAAGTTTMKGAKSAANRASLSSSHMTKAVVPENICPEGEVLVHCHEFVIELEYIHDGAGTALGVTTDDIDDHGDNSNVDSIANNELWGFSLRMSPAPTAPVRRRGSSIVVRPQQNAGADAIENGELEDKADDNVNELLEAEMKMALQSRKATGFVASATSTRASLMVHHSTSGDDANVTRLPRLTAFGDRAPAESSNVQQDSQSMSTLKSEAVTELSSVSVPATAPTSESSDSLLASAGAVNATDNNADSSADAGRDTDAAMDASTTTTPTVFARGTLELHADALADQVLGELRLVYYRKTDATTGLFTGNDAVLRMLRPQLASAIATASRPRATAQLVLDLSSVSTAALARIVARAAKLGTDTATVMPHDSHGVRSSRPVGGSLVTRSVVRAARALLPLRRLCAYGAWGRAAPQDVGKFARSGAGTIAGVGAGDASVNGGVAAYLLDKNDSASVTDNLKATSATADVLEPSEVDAMRAECHEREFLDHVFGTLMTDVVAAARTKQEEMTATSTVESTEDDSFDMNAIENPVMSTSGGALESPQELRAHRHVKRASRSSMVVLAAEQGAALGLSGTAMYRRAVASALALSAEDEGADAGDKPNASAAASPAVPEKTIQAAIAAQALAEAPPFNVSRLHEALELIRERAGTTTDSERHGGNDTAVSNIRVDSDTLVLVRTMLSVMLRLHSELHKGCPSWHRARGALELARELASSVPPILASRYAASLDDTCVPVLTSAAAFGQRWAVEAAQLSWWVRRLFRQPVARVVRAMRAGRRAAFLHGMARFIHRRKRAVVHAQAVYRAVSVRRDYCRVLIAIEVIQRVWRGRHGRTAAALRHRGLTRLQATARAAMTRREFCVARRAAVRLQAGARGRRGRLTSLNTLIHRALALASTHARANANISASADDMASNFTGDNGDGDFKAAVAVAARLGPRTDATLQLLNTAEVVQRGISALECRSLDDAVSALRALQNEPKLHRGRPALGLAPQGAVVMSLIFDAVENQLLPMHLRAALASGRVSLSPATLGVDTAHVSILELQKLLLLADEVFPGIEARASSPLAQLITSARLIVQSRRCILHGGDFENAVNADSSTNADAIVDAIADADTSDGADINTDSKVNVGNETESNRDAGLAEATSFIRAHHRSRAKMHHARTESVDSLHPLATRELRHIECANILTPAVKALEKAFQNGRIAVIAMHLEDSTSTQESSNDVVRFVDASEIQIEPLELAVESMVAARRFFAKRASEAGDVEVEAEADVLAEAGAEAKILAARRELASNSVKERDEKKQEHGEGDTSETDAQVKARAAAARKKRQQKNAERGWIAAAPQATKLDDDGGLALSESGNALQEADFGFEGESENLGDSEDEGESKEFSEDVARTNAYIANEALALERIDNYIRSGRLLIALREAMKNREYKEGMRLLSTVRRVLPDADNPPEARAEDGAEQEAEDSANAIESSERDDIEGWAVVAAVRAEVEATRDAAANSAHVREIHTELQYHGDSGEPGVLTELLSRALRARVDASPDANIRATLDAVRKRARRLATAASNIQAALAIPGADTEAIELSLSQADKVGLDHEIISKARSRLTNARQLRSKAAEAVAKLDADALPAILEECDNANISLPVAARARALLMLSTEELLTLRLERGRHGEFVSAAAGTDAGNTMKTDGTATTLGEDAELTQMSLKLSAARHAKDPTTFSIAQFPALRRGVFGKRTRDEVGMGRHAAGPQVPLTVTSQQAAAEAAARHIACYRDQSRGYSEAAEALLALGIMTPASSASNVSDKPGMRRVQELDLDAMGVENTTSGTSSPAAAAVSAENAVELERLRDEVFVQLLLALDEAQRARQQQKCVRLWGLLFLCLHAFAPSELLFDYVDNFIRIEDEQTCLLELHKARAGRRCRVRMPSPEEIATIDTRQFCSVALMNMRYDVSE